jgi:hypothetical protein
LGCCRTGAWGGAWLSWDDETGWSYARLGTDTHEVLFEATVDSLRRVFAAPEDVAGIAEGLVRHWPPRGRVRGGVGTAIRGAEVDRRFSPAQRRVGRTTILISGSPQGGVPGCVAGGVSAVVYGRGVPTWGRCALAWPYKTVSYVVIARWAVYGAGYVELDCSGRAVGDRRAADPTVEGAATGRRNAGHS